MLPSCVRLHIFDATLLRSSLDFHTGTIDAAWKLCKSFIPNSLGAKHKDLFLYCRMWQWRYVLHHKNIAKEIVKMLKSQS